MKVADVMSKHVDFVLARTTVKEAVTLIFGRGINGVPVCKDKQVVGFITERDILVKFYPTIEEYIEDFPRASNFEEMEKKVPEIFSLAVENIMSRTPIIVTADTPLLRAQSLMFIHKVGRLPVVDKKGNLIGIISKGDIFRALVGDNLLFVEDEDYNDWLSKTYYLAVDVKDRLDYEIPDLLNVFHENKVTKVIDIGCGTGDHAIELAKRGFSTLAIDRSRGMIDEANKRKENLREEVRDKVDFYHGEAKDILAKLGQKFEAAFFMGNTISHNPHTYKETIKNITQYLLGKKLMIFQVTNFEKVLKAKRRLYNFTFACLKGEPKKEYGFLEFYDLPDRKQETILKTFAIFVSETGKRWKYIGLRNSFLAYITKDKIEKVLKENKFTKISFFGSFFDGRKWDYLFRKPFNVLESDWLNVIASQ